MMEYVIEFLLEIVFEIGAGICKNKKTPKWLRYLLISLFGIFVIAVIGFIFLLGFIMMDEYRIAGILFILLGLFFIIMSIIKFRRAYSDFAAEKE